MIGAALLLLALAGDPTTYSGGQPEWCRTGWRCEPAAVAQHRTETAAAATAELAYLMAENDALRARRQRPWGWVAACGPAASLSVDDGNTTLAGTLSCVVGLGFRF